MKNMPKEIFAGEIWMIKPSAQGERWVGDDEDARKIICGEKVKVMGINMDGEFEVEDFNTGEAFELCEEHFERMVGNFDMDSEDDPTF